jgi:hypothetical protein
VLSAGGSRAKAGLADRRRAARMNDLMRSPTILAATITVAVDRAKPLVDLGRK